MSLIIPMLAFATAVVGLIVRLRWFYQGMTDYDRVRIEAYYQRRGERVAGLRRAGVDSLILGGIRIFDVRIADHDGRSTISKIGVQYRRYSRPKLWLYDSDGRRYPVI